MSTIEQVKPAPVRSTERRGHGLVGRTAATFLDRGAQRDAPRHVAVAAGGLRDDARRDPDVGVLRRLSLGPRPGARTGPCNWLFRQFGAA